MSRNNSQLMRTNETNSSKLKSVLILTIKNIIDLKDEHDLSIGDIKWCVSVSSHNKD
jgi:hypothetical protein